VREACHPQSIDSVGFVKYIIHKFCAHSLRVGAVARKPNKEWIQQMARNATLEYWET
jgi:hypothetical protein